MVVGVAAAELDRLHERIAGRFGRSEPRARVREYVSGLVAGLERKNGWTLAERAGEVSPDGMQRLLRSADWDTREVRDDVRDYVLENLGDPGGVLIADETGFLKKGTRSAGVQRQYSGTAGRTENCQIGVFLAYASSHGHALIDRELYVPASWAEDRDRCREAGIPHDVEFATKPRLAQAMLARALDAGVPFAWFTADEVYGQAKYLRRWLEERGVAYVMAIRCSDTFPVSGTEQRADALTAALSARSWQRLSAGPVGPGSTTGPGSPSRPAPRPAAGTGCWPAAPCTTPVKSPITPATGPVVPAWWTWPGPPAAAGTSKNASSKPRTRPGWTTTRSGPGGPGTPTSPCPCWPWPGCPPPAPKPQKGNQHQRSGHDRLHVTGDPPPDDQPHPMLHA